MKRQHAISIVAIIVLLIGVSAYTTMAEKVPEQSVSPRQFKQLLEQHQGNADVVLLDIRTPREFKQGHIQGAVLLDYYSRDFVERLKAFDRGKTYLVYCRSGNRSGKSLPLFEQLGFRHAYHLETGINGWLKERYPVVQ